MSTLNVPLQLNGGKKSPLMLYPRELYVEYDDSGAPANLWVGPYKDININANQTQSDAFPIKVSNASSADSFLNDDTFLSNSKAGSSKTRLGNFNIKNNGNKASRQYIWTTIYSGSVSDEDVVEANSSTSIINYNTFKYINIDQLGRFVAKRGGEVFGTAFPSNPSDGQVFFKLAT